MLHVHLDQQISINMNKEPIHIISLGAGVQSSTMALMAARGLITPMPVAAIFADVGDEPQSVYKWLDYLETQLPFPVIRVSNGVLSEDALKVRTRKKDGKKYVKINIPGFTYMPSGSVGLNRRQCTRDFKIVPIHRAIKKLMKEHKTSAVQWIGISSDEALRMKESRNRGVINIWPLVERGMTRHACLKWMATNNYPTPPRSACTYCPFHSDAEWRRLKDQEPEAFAHAVNFEKRMHAALEVDELWDGSIFLHRSMKPLLEVDFSTEEERGQINLFNNECEGMCGV